MSAGFLEILPSVSETRRDSGKTLKLIVFMSGSYNNGWREMFMSKWLGICQRLTCIKDMKDIRICRFIKNAPERLTGA